YLGAKLGGQPLMILSSAIGLRVALVTGHLPLREVASRITVELVSEKIKLFHQSLVRDFNIRKPRIAVLALNPHAGDGGVIGKEDQDIIRTAVSQTKINGLLYG